MSEEIKEILWIIKSCKQDYDKQKDGMHTFDYGELYLLFNYITNLQQENERLRNTILTTPYTKVVRERDRYKSRCEKASEYIKFNATSNYYDGKTNMFRREIDLLNILQGSEDNE